MKGSHGEGWVGCRSAKKFKVAESYLTVLFLKLFLLLYFYFFPLKNEKYFIS
jgi:hypothetical protein